MSDIKKIFSMMSRMNMINESSYRELINENRESKNQSLARRELRKSVSEENLQRVFDELRGTIPNAKMAESHFLPGVARYYVNGNLNSSQNRNFINDLIKFLVEKGQNGSINQYFDGVSFEELNHTYLPQMQQSNEEMKNNVSQQEFGGNNGYEIVLIDSQSDAEEYSRYTNWCITTMPEQFAEYTDHGANAVYFALKDGFESLSPTRGENAPLDEYGLSMISVMVSPDGNLAYCTSRWNHKIPTGKDDHILTIEELSNVIGENFYEVFKPYSESEAQYRQESGEYDGEDYNPQYTMEQQLSNGYAVYKDEADDLYCIVTDPETIGVNNVIWFNDYEGNAEVDLVSVMKDGDYAYFDTNTGQLLEVDGYKWFSRAETLRPEDDFVEIECDEGTTLIDPEGKNLLGGFYDDIHYCYNNFYCYPTGWMIITQGDFQNIWDIDDGFYFDEFQPCVIYDSFDDSFAIGTREELYYFIIPKDGKLHVVGDGSDKYLFDGFISTHSVHFRKIVRKGQQYYILGEDESLIPTEKPEK